MAAIAIGLWPEEPRTVDLEKSIAVVVALAAWVASEMSGFATPKAGDVRLFQSFSESISDAERDYFRTHDMGNPISYQRISGMRAIVVDWIGPKYEFVDPRLQKLWSAAHSDMDAFFERFGIVTGVSNNPDFATVKTAEDILTGQSSALTDRNAADLNALARSLSTKMDAFEREARRRLDA